MLPLTFYQRCFIKFEELKLSDWLPSQQKFETFPIPVTRKFNYLKKRRKSKIEVAAIIY
jgi:hypothetical protein